MNLRVYGNRPLKTLPGLATRPTPARVREALFNIWSDIAGCRWLDLCAGSGTMGAEALCRGAANIIGIEQSGRACSVIQQNWKTLAKPSQQFQVVRGNVAQRLPGLAGQQFDFIYFDPPYASDLYEPVVEAIAHYQLLAPTGELAIEHQPNRWPHDDLMQWVQSLKQLEICRQKVYGNTALLFLQRSES